MTTTEPAAPVLADIVAAAHAATTDSVDACAGPLTLCIRGGNDVAAIADRLTGQGSSTIPPLEVVIADSGAIGSDRLPAELIPTPGRATVVHDRGITAVADDHLLWVFDLDSGVAVRWSANPADVPVWEISSPLRAAIRWWALLHSAVLVHAGAVANEQGAALLVGVGGTGKSTTTMGCLGTELDVLGDDYCIVDVSAERPVVHALYTIAKLDDVSLDLLPALRERVIGPGMRGKSLVRLDPLTTDRRAAPVIATCDVHRGAERTLVEPGHRARILRAVAPSSMFQLRLHERETFEAISRLVRSTEPAMVRVRRPDEVAPALDGYLRERVMGSAGDVTVIVPARNAGLTIERTLRSLATQSTGSPQLVVVDDRSTDDTATIATGAGATVVDGEGRGPGAARNTGIELAATALVAFCDADDHWPTDRLAHDLRALDAHPEIDMVVGLTRFEADDPALLAGHHFDGPDPVARIPHFGAVTIRSEAVGRIGPIDADLANYEDYDWYFRARDLGIRRLDHDMVSLVYRVHPGSTSRLNPPTPTDLMRVMQRSLQRRRAAEGSRS